MAAAAAVNITHAAVLVVAAAAAVISVVDALVVFDPNFHAI